MTYLAKPKFQHPAAAVNALGYTRRDYEGAVSTLCAGCGHDAIAAAIVQACFELDLPPHRIAKLSGIGCSSKMPNYILGSSHGFNSVHGRMPSVLTGANLANRDLIYLGVSGDGDSASIGLGQFAHSLRRGVNMVYVVANNGVYGLTRGQFSATADRGSPSKRGVINIDEPIDLVAVALQVGATFVARGFSGDREQLVPLLKAAILHRGAAFIDCISPCVAFNNHAESTKSFTYVRAHDEAVTELEVRRGAAAPAAPDGAVNGEVIEQNGASVLLRSLAPGYDPHDRVAAMLHLETRRADGALATGLLYVDPDPWDLHAHLETINEPLNQLRDDDLCPGAGSLAEFNGTLR
ncbi:MAG TPA: 2-oxoacid:ferredoxin oxidoreductase subunit beta [bacterium]|nr:2-oxoacid:ferredoxin oxidoreductase subunit beta [bacterium]